MLLFLLLFYEMVERVGLFRETRIYALHPGLMLVGRDSFSRVPQGIFPCFYFTVSLFIIRDVRLVGLFPPRIFLAPPPLNIFDFI